MYKKSKTETMINSPFDNVIVTVKSKYIKDFGTLTKRLALEQGTSVHLEDLVNIVGTVVSLPKQISQEKKDRGFSMDNIQVGDGVIFSFNVIYDFFQKEVEGELLYKNKIHYKGKNYWLADVTKIFAVIRNEEIIMINGYVMAMPFSEDLIITQESNKVARKSKFSRVIHIGEPKSGQEKINVRQDDQIYYNPKKATKYQINNKPFIILTQQQVFGVKVN